jgi:HEPN domain-containing protein
MEQAEKTSYWFEIAEYDLETARAMLKTKRYLYVGFMCHQTIEKALKGAYAAAKQATPPYSHNLAKIAVDAGIYDTLSGAHKEFVATLEPLNIEARYPTYKEKLLKSLTETRCRELVKGTEELLAWIKERSMKK